MRVSRISVVSLEVIERDTEQGHGSLPSNPASVQQLRTAWILVETLLGDGPLLQAAYQVIMSAPSGHKTPLMNWEVSSTSSISVGIVSANLNLCREPRLHLC